MTRIGVDFGGTKIEAALLDDTGWIARRDRLPNPGDYDGAITTVRDLVLRIEAEEAIAATVGVGAPGSVSPRTGLIRNANSAYLNGRAFADDLSAALDRSVRLANDANCFALSEAIDGAAAGHASVFGLIVGTGCGGGLVIDGAVVAGASGLAGEIGHLPLPWPRDGEAEVAPCWCGQRGCLESWISGTGFARDFAAVTGRDVPAPAIVERARTGEADAKDALSRYVDRLGRGLAMIVNIVDPGAIVIGGGMSNVPEIYDGLADIVRAYVFSDGWSGAIVPARWGDSSGVRGAAMLWPA